MVASPEGATEILPSECFLSPLPGLNTNFLLPGAARFALASGYSLWPLPGPRSTISQDRRERIRNISQSSKGVALAYPVWAAHVEASLSNGQIRSPFQRPLRGEQCQVRMVVLLAQMSQEYVPGLPIECLGEIFRHVVV